MPRKPRLFVPGATYHVYCRVARGEFVFAEPSEAEEFIGIVRETADRDGLSVLAWCVMANHYHLVVETAAVPLWRSMARIQGRFARGFNRRRGYLGRLWQSRYKARVVATNEYFRLVVAYVHLNPVAAEIVRDPAAYPLSGHREAIGSSRPGLLDVGRLLAAFDADDVSRARGSYLAWLRLVAEERWLRAGVASLPWWQEAEHDDEVAQPRSREDLRTFDGRGFELERPELDLDEVAVRFQNATGLEVADLASRRREERLTQGRVDLAAIAIGRYGHRVCDVAALLLKHSGTVSRWLSVADRQSLEEGSYRRHLDALDRAVAAGPSPNVTT